MISEKYGIAPGDFLTLTHEYLDRALERSRNKRFAEQTEQFKQKMEKLLTEERELPLCDHSWYDEKPDRLFAETYNQWHAYNDPVKKLAADGCRLLRGGVLLGKEEYLDKAKEWGLYIVRNHGFHVDHYDSGMEFAGTGGHLAELFAVLYRKLDEQQLKLFTDQLTACGEAIMRCQKIWLSELSRMAYSNHLAIQNSGLLKIGFVLEREDWVENVLSGPRSFGRMLVGATLDNGLCYESSTRYHYATFGGLVSTAQTVQCCPALGKDLFRGVYAGGRTLKQMFDAPLTLLLPNGELPQIGDAYAVTHPPLWESHKKMYETAYDVYGDPKYIWFLKQNRNWVPSLFSGPESLNRKSTPLKGGTRQWPEHGFALISSDKGEQYWKGNGFTAFITGDRSGIHNHKDTLSLQVFAKGKLWTVDALSRPCIGHGFSSPIQSAFNRKTLAHNTVVIDERDQESVRRPLPVTMFRELDKCTSITMTDEDGQCCPGIRMKRHAAVTDEYCLDIFEVESDKEHTCDWIVHLRSDKSAVCSLDWKESRLSDREPYSVLNSVRKAELAEQGTLISWNQEHDEMLLFLSAGTDGELFRCTYPQSEVESQNNGEMFMLRVTGKSVLFCALYQLRNGVEWKVVSCDKTFNGEKQEILAELQNGEKTESHILSGI